MIPYGFLIDSTSFKSKSFELININYSDGIKKPMNVLYFHSQLYTNINSCTEPAMKLITNLNYVNFTGI